MRCRCKPWLRESGWIVSLNKHAGEFSELRLGEKLVAVVHPSFRILLLPILALFIFVYTVILIPLAIILALFVILYLVSVRTLRYFITTERVVMMRRFPHKDQREFLLADVDGLTVVQGFIAKSLNYGSVHPQFSNRDDRASTHRLGALSQISRPNEISAVINSRRSRKGS